MALDEELSLGIAPALDAVDALEARINAAAEAGSAAFTSTLSGFSTEAAQVGDAVAAAITDGAERGAAAITEAVSEATPQLTASIDTSDVEASLNQIDDPSLTATIDTAQAETDLAAVTDNAPTVLVTTEADTAGIDEADTALEGLTDRASAPIVASVTVDADSIAETSDALDGLRSAAQDASQLGPIDLFGGGGGAASAGISDLAAATGAAAGGASALEAGTAALSPQLAAVAVASAGAGVGIASAFEEAVGAEAAMIRLRDVLGDNADSFLQFDGNVAGFVGTMEELALATGSADDGMIVASANFADLGKQAGYSSEEVAGSAQQLSVLASYIAATRPELGSADQIIGRLGVTLQRGGRFAQQMGLDIGTAGQIAERAAELFDKPKDSLTGYERSVAGLTVAYERLGDRVGPAIERATDNPQIALRALEARLGEVAEAAGGGFLGPTLDTLEALAPVAEKAATILAKIAEGGVRVLAVEAQGLAFVLGKVAGLLNNEVVGALVAAGGGFLAARGSLSALLSLTAQVAPNLAAVALRLNVGEGIAAQFSGLASATSQIETAFSTAEQAGTQFATANEVLSALLNGVADEQRDLIGTMVEGNEVYNLATSAVEANNVLQEKAAALLDASISVREAAAAKQRLLIEAELGSASAKEALVGADEALVAAESGLATATVEHAAAAQTAGAASAELAVAMGSEGAAVTEAAAAASVASTELAGATAATGELATASTALNPILLGIAAAAALAVGAFVLFSGDDIAADANKATEALRSYGDALDYTSGQLAAGSQSALRARFQQDKEAVDQVRDSILQLSEEATLALDRVGFFNQAGPAIRGDAAALERARAAAIRSGELQVTVTPTSDVQSAPGTDISPEVYAEAMEAANAAAQAAFSKSGSKRAAEEAAAAAIEAYGLTVDEGIERISVSKKGSFKIFEDLVDAQKVAEDAAVAAAQADIKGADATQVGNIRYLASIGLLNRLSGAEGERARDLLREADAAERATEQTRILDGIRLKATRERASDVFAGQEAILGGGAANAAQIAAARALQASAGFEDLDQSVQDAVLSLIDFGNEAITSARQSGELFASTGELALGMGDLTDRLNSAADAFVNILSSQQALGSSTRSLNNLLDDLGPKTREIGTNLNDSSAAFDLSSINADNYQEYLRLLPRAVQDAIEGRNQAVETANRDLAQAQKDRPLDEGLLAQRYAEGEFSDGLAGDSNAAAVDKAEKSAEQKAAEVRAAIAQNADALQDVQGQARDNARELADYFDQVGVAIRKEAAEMLKAGSTTEEVTARIRERRDALIEVATQAGFTETQINDVLTQQRLLPTQVAIDLKESGVDKIVGAIQRLATVLAGLDDIDPIVANAIRGIEDPTKQVEAFNNAIAELPREQQTKLRLIYDVPDPEAFKTEQERKLQAGLPFQIGISMGLDQESALALDQQFADVISALPSTAPIKITPEIAQGIQEFDAATQEAANRDWAVLLDPTTDPVSASAAKADLERIAAERDALIKATISPESVSATEAELALAALDRTVVFKTTVDPATGKTTAETLAELVPSSADDPTGGGGGLFGGIRKKFSDAIASVFSSTLPVSMRPTVDPDNKASATRILDEAAEPRRANYRPTVSAPDEASTNRRLDDVADDRSAPMNPAVDAPAEAATDSRLDGVAAPRQAPISPTVDAGALAETESFLRTWASSLNLTARTTVSVIREGIGSLIPGGSSGSSSGGSAPRQQTQPAAGGRSTNTPESLRQQAIDIVRADLRSTGDDDLPIRDYSTDERNRKIPESVVNSVSRGSAGNIAYYIRDRQARFPGFAEGGTTLTADELARIRRVITDSGAAFTGIDYRPASAGPGLVAPGAFRLAEPSTGGEYLLSRDPQFRDANRDLLRVAAIDLGVPLAEGERGRPAYLNVDDLGVKYPTALPSVLNRPTIDQPTVGGRDLAAAVAALAGAVTGLSSRQQQIAPRFTVRPTIVVSGGHGGPSSRPIIEDVRTEIITGGR